MICSQFRNSHRPLVACLLVSATILLALATAVQAASPWESLVPFKKATPVDPNGQYQVAQSNGPWMIMATTFRGDKAQEQAQQLAVEIRSKLKVSAYTYEKSFDFTKKEHGIGFNPDGTPITMRYQQKEVINEVAVLVGDYVAIDDAAAQKMLKKIKAFDPDCLKSEQAKNGQSLGAFQQLQKSLMPGAASQGPLVHAFMAPNPLLPKEYFASHGVDKFILDLNKGVPHSLLECPGKYSICIATFSGTAIIDQKKIAEVESKGKSMPDHLVQAAEKAHKLTTWLHDNPYGGQKWEAYEYHDRDKSIVCVGSFDSLGITRQDGSLQVDPQVERVLATFGQDAGIMAGTKTNAKAIDVNYPSGTPAGARTSPDLILFDIAPKPMEVPRRSISADYQQKPKREL